MKRILINALGGAVAFGLVWSLLFDDKQTNYSGIYGGICYFVVSMLIAIIPRRN
ncbi:hypothetical protein [Paenibacillus phytorum]|uniref:hypothetical protein n=1 Tax=Paenibacillus phytorum TaxID=2654977 RepID=UPI001491444B|nr:hypothetical protein [Paenibacillus phytorum]